MKVTIKKLIFFFIILAVCLMTACNSNGGKSNKQSSTLDVSGTYNVIFTFGDEPGENEVWILQQTGSEVTIVFGETPRTPNTVSGSNLIIAWEWDEEDEETGDTIHVQVNATLEINGDEITGTGTTTAGEEVTAISFNMTRTSTSSVIPIFNIPEASITVDGVISDWDLVPTYVNDESGDATEGTGTDIQSVKVARDSSNLYILIKTDAQFPTDYEYEFVLRDDSGDELGGTGFRYETGIFQWQITGGQICVAATGYVELSFPYDGEITPDFNYIVTQKIYKTDNFYDSVDEAMFIGYTILPEL